MGQWIPNILKQWWTCFVVTCSARSCQYPTNTDICTPFSWNGWKTTTRTRRTISKDTKIHDKIGNCKNFGYSVPCKSGYLFEVDRFRILSDKKKLSWLSCFWVWLSSMIAPVLWWSSWKVKPTHLRWAIKVGLVLPLQWMPLLPIKASISCHYLNLAGFDPSLTT